MFAKYLLRANENKGDKKHCMDHVFKVGKYKFRMETLVCVSSVFVFLLGFTVIVVYAANIFNDQKAESKFATPQLIIPKVGDRDVTVRRRRRKKKKKKRKEEEDRR